MHMSTSASQHPGAPPPRTPAARATEVWAPSPDVALTGSADTRFVVLDLASPGSEPAVLAGPAAAIWAAVDGTRDTAGVTAAVARSVGLDAEEVNEDVATFLETLHGNGLLVRSPVPAPPPASPGAEA